MPRKTTAWMTAASTLTSTLVPQVVPSVVPSVGDGAKKLSWRAVFMKQLFCVTGLEMDEE